MPKERMWVEYDDGTHLSQSQKKPGEYSPLTRDDGTNKLGQVTLSPIVEDEADPIRNSPPVFVNGTNEYGPASRATQYDELVAALSSLASVYITVAAMKAAPRIKRWLNDDASPAIKSAWSRIARTRVADRESGSVEMPILIEAAPAERSKEVDAAFAEPRISISNAEWQERFRTMLLAGAIREEQWRVLSTARIEGDDRDVVELQNAMVKLSPQQVADGIRLMIEANPSLFDEETSAKLMKILGGDRTADGQCVPARDEKIKEAPRLTRGEN